MNYSEWNLVIQHPNFDDLAWGLNFNKSLNPFGTINDTTMLWGIDFFKDIIMQSGPNKCVQKELLFHKDPTTFTLEDG
ncbi:unnamed protein product [Prunus armeniaca]|uniref:Uncharacterized protein n=1 Tax=Prunus armeniaca TaxID=36596 RepID=A0A6J5UT64_PRUAR|nr:unnamed protein product [Prunus armeniaca]